MKGLNLLILCWLAVSIPVSCSLYFAYVGRNDLGAISALMLIVTVMLMIALSPIKEKGE